MEWWYKNETQVVTADTIARLQDAIKTVLREGKSLALVHLYDDKKNFYIKTNNKISLNYFLCQHGFEEMEEDGPTSGLTLLYGAT